MEIKSIHDLEELKEEFIEELDDKDRRDARVYIEAFIDWLKSEFVYNG